MILFFCFFFTFRLRRTEKFVVCFCQEKNVISCYSLCMIQNQKGRHQKEIAGMQKNVSKMIYGKLFTQKLNGAVLIYCYQ